MGTMVNGATEQHGAAAGFRKGSKFRPEFTKSFREPFRSVCVCPRAACRKDKTSFYAAEQYCLVTFRLEHLKLRGSIDIRTKTTRLDFSTQAVFAGSLASTC